MTLDSTYHVMPWQGMWRVYVEGDPLALSTHKTCDAAIRWCRRDALDTTSEAIVVYNGFSEIAQEAVGDSDRMPTSV
jgi:hypothetical protein